jgi:arylsulfatase A-like enzyme
MLGLVNRGFSMADYSQHIVHILRDGAGYHSVLGGLQHVAKDPAQIGYDRILEGERSPEKVVSRTVDFLKDAPSQPFFLDVGFFVTHREFPEPGPDEDPRYCLPPAPMPDTPENRYDMAAYKASARILDNSIGAVLDGLNANGLAEDTLVICTTDHGLAFPGMKCNLTDHGIGVMLIIRGPDGFTGGKVCDAMVSHIDVLPTICDLLDIAAPEGVQGSSMVPLIRGEAEAIHDEIFAEVNYHAAYEPQRAVRTQRWKYIRWYSDRQKPVLPNCDGSPTKDVWVQHGWQDQYIAPEQLYDLIFDPNETHNLISDSVVTPVLEDMRHRLDGWMLETEDPLLHGPVPPDPGAQLNDPASISPPYSLYTVPFN